MPQVFVGSLPEGEPSEVWGTDLLFERGKSYLIEAASGRGKTSLCAFLSGLRSDFAGEISFDGKPIGEYDDLLLRRETFAVMPQDHRLFPELTALENVMLKNQLTQFCTPSEIRQRLEQLGLKDRIDRPCQFLSIGQQQRVAFVRMLCQPADFYLLDEPVSHLDDQNAELMADMLSQTQERTGAAVMVTSIGRHLPYNYDCILKL